MIVDMLGVDVRCDDRLCIIAKHLADKSLAYLQCEFRRNVLLGKVLLPALRFKNKLSRRGFENVLP